MQNFQIMHLDQATDVLRDDLIEGGTKRRGLDLLLNTVPSNKVFYAGTVMGHGALALAHACMDHQKESHIFISGDDNHPMVQKLRDTNAVLHIRPPLPIAALHEQALDMAAGETVFPPGFDMPSFEKSLVLSLKGFDASPYDEIWTTSVTGTLTRALKRTFSAKAFKTVSVVKSGIGDFTAPEKYHQPAKNPPPYPACPYTDAKLWQFRAKAQGKALLWNTAG